MSARTASRLFARYGPWAVVTGASSGIGEAVAERLAGEGIHLVLLARSASRLHPLADQLRAAHGIQVTVVPVDLAESTGVAELTAATDGLDVGLLVAAAGFGTSGPFISADLDTELSMLAVNCAAVTAQAWAFGRRFADRGRGGIVLFGSLVGFQGTPMAAHYAATKAYVQVLAEALALELRPHGVDVLASAPGPVHSGFAARAGMTMGRALQPEQVAAGTLAALGRRSVVLPGTLSKVLRGSLSPLPRRLQVRIMGRVMTGLTDRG